MRRVWVTSFETVSTGVCISGRLANGKRMYQHCLLDCLLYSRWKAKLQDIKESRRRGTVKAPFLRISDSDP
jgi:hypothetical protein